MMAPFPWWVDALLAIVVAWPLAFVVVLILGFMGKFASGPWRVLAWGLGVGLGLILLVAGGAMLVQPAQDAWTKLRLKAISGVTKEPRTVNGFVLPAGSKVQWSNVNKQDFYVADVPANVAMLGVVGKGEIDHDARAPEEYYDLSLVEPKRFDAWACGPGQARLKEDASMLACTLAVDTAWMERGVKLAGAADFYPEQSSLDDGPKLQALGIVGTLAADALCGGSTLPAGTAVTGPMRGELQVREDAPTPAHDVAGCLR